MHEAATIEGGELPGDKVMMINDVARAFLEASVTQHMCVDFPNQYRSGSYVIHDNVVHSKMILCGPRDAPMNWQEEVAKELRRLGFQRGICSPCLYFHEGRN